MRKPLEILLNILFWVLSSLLIINSFSITAQEIEIINGLEQLRIVRDSTLLSKLCIAIIAAAIVFYSNLFLWQNLKRKKYLPIFWCIALAPLYFLLYSFFNLLFLGAGGINPPTSIVLGIGVFYIATSISYVLALDLRKSKSLAEQALLDKKISDLQFLRNQLHPHFLFNALNNLLSMVDQSRDAQLALAIDKLSGLMRYVVYEIGEKQVAISKELAFVDDFVALQKMRFNADEIEFIAEEKIDDKGYQIEPGILIPFVENAFKFGVMPEKRSIIRMTTKVQQGDFSFSISNPIYPENVGFNYSGMGLKQTKERLRMVYGNQFTLDIAEGEEFQVHLEIKKS